MLFGHEHDHDTHVSTIHAPQGKAPLWCKIVFALAAAFVVVIAQPWRPW